MSTATFDTSLKPQIYSAVIGVFGGKLLLCVAFLLCVQLAPLHKLAAQETVKAPPIRFTQLVRQGLIAAGVLNKPAYSATKEDLKQALKHYRLIYNDGLATQDDKANIESLIDKLEAAYRFKRVRDNNGIDLLLPTAIIPAENNESDNLETRFFSGREHYEARIITFRHQLTSNPPSELLRKILKSLSQ